MLLRISTFLFLLVALVACQAEAENFRVQSYQLDQSIFSHSVRYFVSQADLQDSLIQQKQAFRFGEHGMINCDVYAKDIVLGRNDSIRLGIIHPLERVYDYPRSIELPDQLVLSAYGQDTIPFSLSQPNVGPVTSRTYFRINRDYYALAALDSSRQRIDIRPLERRPSSPAVAQLTTRFKQVPVKTLDGRDTLVRHQHGDAMLLYFFDLGPDGGQGLVELYEQLSQATGARPTLIPINRSNSEANLREFLEENQLELPIYRATGATCGGLQCHPRLPYGLWINPEGRIVSHYLDGGQLKERLLP